MMPIMTSKKRAQVRQQVAKQLSELDGQLLLKVVCLSYGPYAHGRGRGARCGGGVNV